MGKPSSVLIFEYISGGGIENSEDFELLISEGFGMLCTLIQDFSRMDFEIYTLVDNRIFEQFTLKHDDLIKRNQLAFAKINSPSQVTMILENALSNNSYIIIIAPEFSNILYNLVKMVENLIASDQILLNLPSNAILTFTDKRKTESYLKSHKIPTPPSLDLTFQTISYLPSKEYIIKPFDGVGSSDTYSLTSTINRMEFGAFLGHLLDNGRSSSYIIQEKVKGIPLSAFVAAFNGKVKLYVVNSQEFKFEVIKNKNIHKIEYLGGTTPFSKIASDIKSKVKNIAKLICAEFQLTGFFGIDFVYNSKDKSYSIIEINPRVTTPYIAISALFQENKINILESILKDRKLPKMKGKKTFRKAEEKKISLN